MNSSADLGHTGRTANEATEAPNMHAFPGETPEYRSARAELLRREIELRRQMEAVAQARRRAATGRRAS
jgi:predicted dithiol-disulfide oxidoreductase (DUF899 family)